jgi:diacylglycerol kinase (ATP)
MHNPSAGDEDHAAGTIRAAVEAACHEVSLQSMKESDWHRAIDGGVDLVVAAGGDGTVRKVFGQLAGKDVPATILPLGTANNIARSLGFDEDDVGRLVQGWSQGRLQPYDIGILTSAHGEDRFVESAGAGLLAELLVRAEEDDSNDSDKIEKGLRLLLAILADPAPLRWTFELDGGRASDELIGFEVMNVSEAGPQIPLAPAADTADGVLDVVLIRGEDAGGLRAYVEGRLAGDSPDLPRFETQRAFEVVVAPPAGTPLRVDDQVLAANADGVKAVSAWPAAQVQVLLPGSTQ